MPAALRHRGRLHPLTPSPPSTWMRSIYGVRAGTAALATPCDVIEPFTIAGVKQLAHQRACIPICSILSPSAIAPSKQAVVVDVRRH